MRKSSIARSRKARDSIFNSCDCGVCTRSECIIEGEGRAARAAKAPQKGVSSEMSWLKDTRWLWNEWREVRQPLTTATFGGWD